MEIQKLNDELLAPEQKVQEEPKRNTKEWLIEKILMMADENDLELSISNTKLRRMSKVQLQKLLGELGEKVVKQQMAASVGAAGSSDASIALGTLRMVHDLLAAATETGLNSMLPEYGYRIDGFTESLHKPVVSAAVDDCLKEIAATTDVLQYIESPYARLALAWSGAMMSCVRRARIPAPSTNAKDVGPRPARPKNPVQLRPSGGKKDGEKHSPARPNPKDGKQV